MFVKPSFIKKYVKKCGKITKILPHFSIYSDLEDDTEGNQDKNRDGNDANPNTAVNWSDRGDRGYRGGCSAAASITVHEFSSFIKYSH